VHAHQGGNQVKKNKKWNTNVNSATEANRLLRFRGETSPFIVKNHREYIHTYTLWAECRTSLCKASGSCPCIPRFDTKP
jgi:hypothetical protein